jgi:hypothetical protein
MYTPFYLVLLSRLLALASWLRLTSRLHLTGWLRLTLPATHQLQSTSAGHSTSVL